MELVRPVTRTPIWIKLSYSTLLFQMAEMAERLGADAIVCTNSIGPGLLLDIETGRPKLGIKGGLGGVTGKAIFPIALACVYGISQRVSIPVVGVGGVQTAEDAIQMFMAGASAVQLYTAPALHGPKVFSEIMEGLEFFSSRHPEYRTISDMVGVAHGKAETNVFQASPPVVDPQKCTGCGICYPSCAFKAIYFEQRQNQSSLAVITNNCVSCNACVGVCPPEFNAIRAIFKEQR
jgi:NAD-dependent dihydropyrimidine dehydrogenase PreA subunit